MADEPRDEKSPAPQAASDKPASGAPTEPLKAEPARTQPVGEAAPPAPPRASAASSAAASDEATKGAASARNPAAPASPQAKAPGVPAAAKPPAAAGAAKPAHPAAPAPPSGPPDPPPPAGTELPGFIVNLQTALPGAVAAVSYWVGDWTLIVALDRLLDVMRYLRDTPETAFDMLSDLTATDWPPRKAERFDIIYCLWSTTQRRRLRVKTKAGELHPVASVTGVWPAANWLEREVFDMFGINFTGHPDRRRILMPDDWQGHPQRKDYPLEGPGELLLENPVDWLKLRQTTNEADIE